MKADTGAYDLTGGEVPFHHHIYALRQLDKAIVSADPLRMHPRRMLINKLTMYDFAASHGIRHPEVFKVWESIGAVELENCPDRFVLKTTGGSSGHGVIPLIRVSPDAYKIIGQSGEYTQDEVVARLAAELKRGRAYGKIFAEELLKSSRASTAIPEDVKFYCTYGEVLMALLIRREKVAGQGSSSMRFISPDGTDLGDARPDDTSDSSIQVPGQYRQLLEVAAELSKYIGLPFVRVDLYALEDGIRFGEMTRTPGGPQVFRKDLALPMGEAWSRAQIRLELDILNGRKSGPIFGSQRNSG